MTQEWMKDSTLEELIGQDGTVTVSDTTREVKKIRTKCLHF